MEKTKVDIAEISGDSPERNHDVWVPARAINSEVTHIFDLEDMGTAQRSFGKVSSGLEMTNAPSKLMQSIADGTVQNEIMTDKYRAGDVAGMGMERYLILKVFDDMIDRCDVSDGDKQILENHRRPAHCRIKIDALVAGRKFGAVSSASSCAMSLIDSET